MNFTRTSSAMLNDKLCIVQLPIESRYQGRFVKLADLTCKRGRVCSGVNCPCVPSTVSNTPPVEA